MVLLFHIGWSHSCDHTQLGLWLGLGHPRRPHSCLWQSVPAIGWGGSVLHSACLANRIARALNLAVVFEGTNTDATRPLKALAQKPYNNASAEFCWPKQVTRPTQIQGEGITDSLFLLLDGRNSGHSQGWEKSVVANFVESAITAPVSELLGALYPISLSKLWTDPRFFLQSHLSLSEPTLGWVHPLQSCPRTSSSGWWRVGWAAEYWKLSEEIWGDGQSQSRLSLLGQSPDWLGPEDGVRERALFMKDDLEPPAAVHRVARSRTRLSDWTELNWTCPRGP